MTMKITKYMAVILMAVFLVPVICSHNTYANEQETPPVPSGSAIYENTPDEYEVIESEADNEDGIENKVYYSDIQYADISVGNSGYVTKKGLQGANLIEEQYQDLGVKHTLFNVSLDYVVCSESDDYDTEYEYNGKTYYFNYIPGLWPETVHQYNKAGWTMSIVVLLGGTNEDMIYSGARKSGKNYYAWNLDDTEMVELYEAVFNFFGDKYCYNEDPKWASFIQNWIIGNEVNMPNAYNYTGTTDLSVNVELYTRQYKFATEILESHNEDIKTYISLDHSWTHNDEGRGIAGKKFLDAFAEQIESTAPGIDWNIAYHPYPAIMTDSKIWKSDYTTKSVNTEFISGYNLNVLTSYVKEKFGSDVRIILSEQGFTAYGGQEEEQAAAMAYTYYMAEFDDMIDAAIFRSLRDDKAEAANKFLFGLLDSNDNPRPVYNVFKYMDTVNWQSSTSECLATMGKSSWSSIVPNFDPYKFAGTEMESVSNLKAVKYGINKVKVTWSPVDYVSGYIIYRKTASEAKFTYRYIVTGNSYIDTTASESEYNFYRVYPYRMVNGERVLGPSTEYVYAKGGITEAANLKATGRVEGVKLTWTAVVDAEGYIVYGKRGDNSTKFVYVGMTSNLTYTDTNAVKDEYNFYRVYPYYTNSSGKRVLAPSNKYVYAQAGLQPAANIKATGTTAGVKLTWNKVSQAEGYIVYGKRGSSSTKFTYVGMTSNLTYTDTKALSTEYNFYRIYPYYTDGSGKRVLAKSTSYVYAKKK